jgi:hypothetical protein
MASRGWPNDTETSEEAGEPDHPAEHQLVRDREHSLVRQRLEIFDTADHDRIVAFKVFAYEGLVAQADQEIAWAEGGLALIDSRADHHR